jgi:hypothetical protein
MKRFIFVTCCCTGLYLLGAVATSANPITAEYYPFISEIQVTDSVHWNVEVDCNWLLSPVHPPCSIDSFYLFCGQSWPPADSMRHTVIPDVFNSNGIAVLTPQHFPGLKLVKGAIVSLDYRYALYGTYHWSAQIPTSLTPQQSVVYRAYQTCCGFDPGTGQCMIPCTRYDYIISNKPTIGLPNSTAPVVQRISNAVTVSSVRLIPTKARRQIALAVSGQPGSFGKIDLFSADGALVRSLSFACRGPGTYTVSWDGNNKQGRTVPAGTYICRVKIGEDVSCKGFIVW